MKRFFSVVFAVLASASLVHSGEYGGKETKQVASPACPEWYRDNEWNVSLWGTYVLTNTEYARNPDLVDVVQSTTEGGAVLGVYDRYIGDDHAWGGGADAKYFFMRYLGVGVEAFGLSARKGGFDIFEDPRLQVFPRERRTYDHGIGAVLGTFTIRYPVRCTRFAPYAFAGVGAIFGGGEQDELFAHSLVDPPDAMDADAFTVHHGTHTEVLGQFGGGLETRITPHIGWLTDFSWGVIEGPRNNFTMIRTGINFAF